MSTDFSWQLLETGERGWFDSKFCGFIRVQVVSYDAENVTMRFTGKTNVYTHGELITRHRSYFFAERLYKLCKSRQHPGRMYAQLLPARP